MIARGDIVLLDTNVIVEAHRVRCWKMLAQSFRIETVEECCVEAATGDRRRQDYVEVDVEDMRKLVAVHEVKNHFTEKWLSTLRTDILMGGTQ